MKRFFALLLVVLACVCLFAGGANEQSKSEKVITIWIKKNLSDIQDKLLVERFEQIGKEMGVKVNPVIVPTQDLTQKINVSIEAKNTPHIVSLITDTIPMFQSKGLLVPLDELVADVEKTYDVNFLDPISATRIDNQCWAIPYFNCSEVFYYRTDCLKNAGFDSYPKTWAEFGDYIAKLTNANPGVYGYGEAFGVCDDIENHFNFYLYSNDSGLWDVDGKPNFNTPLNIELTKRFVEYYTSGSVPASAASWDSSGNNTSYLSGQSAIIWNGGSVYSVFMNDDNFKQIRENSVVGPAPVGDSGVRRQKAAPISFGLFNFASDEELALSKEILKRLYDPTWYNEWIMSSIPQGLPAIDSMENDPIWDDPNYRAFYDGLEGQVQLGYPCPVTTPAVGVAHSDMVMAKMLQSIVVKNVKVEDAVANAQKQLEKIYAEFK